MRIQVERPKVDLYRVRTFGQKFTATFDFLKENYKLWLKACFYLVLPLCLLQAFALEWFISVAVDNNLAVAVDNADSDGALGNLLVNTGLSYLILIVCLVLGSILLSSICFSLIRYYIGLFFLVIIGLLVAFVPAYLSWPVYIFEDDENVFSSIRRGWRLGVHSFWSLIGLLLLMGIVGNFLQMVTTLPWYFMYLAKVFISATNEGATSVVNSPIYNFIEYIFSVIMNFGTYLAMSLTVVALAFHYGSVAEEVDGVSVEEGIQNFDQLAEKDNDIDNFDKL